MKSDLTLAQHARETLRRLMLRVDAEMTRNQAEAAVDPVHDLRVSIRRLSAALRAFAELLPGKEARQMRRALKPSLDAAAVVRDLDVGLELLQKEGLPETHPLPGQMIDDRRRAALALVGQIYLLRAQDRPACWLPRLEALKEAGALAPAIARAVLPPLAEEFFKTGRKTAQKTESAERLHNFRLAAKRFRYTLELFRPFYGPVFAERLEQVRAIQSILGKRQDCAVMALRLAPLVSDEALAAVHDRVETRAARLEADFHDYWHREFDAPGQSALWSRYLGRPAASEPSERKPAAPPPNPEPGALKEDPREARKAGTRNSAAVPGQDPLTLKEEPREAHKVGVSSETLAPKPVGARSVARAPKKELRVRKVEARDSVKAGAPVETPAPRQAAAANKTRAPKAEPNAPQPQARPRRKEPRP